MKKIISAFLCFVLIFSLDLPAFAVSASDEENKEICLATDKSEEKSSLCAYCGIIHSTPGEKIIGFFHSIANWFKWSLCGRLFTQMKKSLKIRRDVTATNLQGALGWEGDKDAPIVYVDGSYKLRGNGDKVIAFYDRYLEDGAVNWYCSEGYLPCWISEFSADDFNWSISNFCDKITVGGNDFVIMYTRVVLENTGKRDKDIPDFSDELTVLSDNIPEAVAGGEKVTIDFCVGADRFGGDYDWPTGAELKSQGGFDEHYEHMKNYWNERLENIVNIKKLPEEYSELINAYKAGYIYTLVISDGYQLHVGENGYDRVFDHDVIGILATLLELGHTEHFSEYADTILQNIQYPDAAWKFSWPFALYLLKTDDFDTILSYWNDNGGNAGIKTNTHKIAEERIVYNSEILDKEGNVARIMKKTDAIDSNGYWTVDNYSSLLGLTTYSYLCRELYNKYGLEEYQKELEWAQSEYDSLLSSVEAVLRYTMDKYDINYIPISMEMPNELTERKNVLDANWASVYEFGRWDWDGYLFGANQDVFMNDMLDCTYAYIIDAKEGTLPSPYTMGGYTGVSSGYNAGYYCAALAGEKYRTYGIEAYLWLINNGMSCPYGTWECVINSSNNSMWNRTCSTNGWGACQHMWGQSMNTKTLLDSLLAEKADGIIIAGRGVPVSWNKDGEEVAVSDFLCEEGKRIGFEMKTESKVITFTLTGDALESSDVYLEFPAAANNILAVEGSSSFDEGKGRVVLSPGIKQVKITLKNEIK